MKYMKSTKFYFSWIYIIRWLGRVIIKWLEIVREEVRKKLMQVDWEIVREEVRKKVMQVDWETVREELRKKVMQVDW